MITSTEAVVIPVVNMGAERIAVTNKNGIGRFYECCFVDSIRSRRCNAYCALDPRSRQYSATLIAVSVAEYCALFGFCLMLLADFYIG